MYADAPRATADRLVKVLFLLVLILHTNSLPFMWHIRVWAHPLHAFIQSKVMGKRAYWKKWLRELDAQGGITGLRVRTTRRALADDCDYNMHLSNSAYAKNSDQNKMAFAIDAFAPAFVTGGFMALGGSHWLYLKEIPMGTEYVMETRLAGWGDKWMHLVTEFIIYPKGKKVVYKTKAGRPNPPVPTFSAPPSGTDSPASGVPVNGGPAAGEKAEAMVRSASEVLKKVKARVRDPRPDGGVICCVAITDYCFKQGRVTIPPRIALFTGFHSPDPAMREEAMRILLQKDNGIPFVRGKWKEHPLADKLGLDVGLGPDGTTAWAQAVADKMEEANDDIASVGASYMPGL